MNYVYPGIQEEFTGTIHSSRDNLSETITIEFSIKSNKYIKRIILFYR